MFSRLAHLYAGLGHPGSPAPELLARSGWLRGWKQKHPRWGALLLPHSCHLRGGTWHFACLGPSDSLLYLVTLGPQTHPHGCQLRAGLNCPLSR